MSIKFLILPLFLIATQLNAAWNLIWFDDFNQKSYDVTKWSILNRNYTIPNYSKIDMNSCVEINGGNLIISAIMFGGNPINCGLQTLNKISLQYGKIEVRAKFEFGQGVLSAIWMNPENPIYNSSDPDWKINKQYNGEIDIVEHINYDDSVYQTVHTYMTAKIGKNNSLLNGLNPPHYIKYKKDSTKYVTYSVEMFPDKIIFYLDGIKTFEYLKTSINKMLQFPFDQKRYLMFDMFVGTSGSWQGPIDKTKLPVKMYVDWVKFYDLI